MTDIDEDSITLFVPAWGQTHLDYLRRFALPSVLQSGNLPACNWNRIIVRGSTVGPVGPLMGVLSEAFKGYPAEFQITDYGTHDNALLGALRDTIRHCITTQTRMLLVIPDAIFANGSIFNMRQYARGKPVCFAAPHLRVEVGPFIKSFDETRKISTIEGSPSDWLVRMAFDHPHQSLTGSFDDKDNGTLTGGISLTWISEELTTIIHYLPNIWLAWFTESDADFFNSATSFCAYDHHWGKHLDGEGRLRVISDSSFFFAVELTDPAANRIQVRPGSRLDERSEAGHSNLGAFVGTLKG